MSRELKQLLKKYNVYPSKRLGQNFLVDKSVLRKIITAADPRPSDVVVEIGPGTGILTQELAKRVKKVIAIEKDPKMVEILKDLLKCWNVENVEIVRGDVLELDPKPYILKPYKIVANLPYYIVAPVIRKFLEASIKPGLMVLGVQKEVAQRICAKPPNMNLLAVSVQFYVRPVKSLQGKFNEAGPEIISYISKKSFWPQPKVDGAILKISNLKSLQSRAPKQNNLATGQAISLRGRQISKIQRDLFFKIVKAGFSQPRKQLINNLSKRLKIDKTKAERWLQKNKIQPSQRAETLTVEDWINLTKSYKIN